MLYLLKGNLIFSFTLIFFLLTCIEPLLSLVVESKTTECDIPCPPHTHMYTCDLLFFFLFLLMSIKKVASLGVRRLSM